MAACPSEQSSQARAALCGYREPPFTAEQLGPLESNRIIECLASLNCSAWSLSNHGAEL
jgi:hypothetical protein